MGKENPDKCKPSGKDREDRAVISKNKFDPLSIDVKYPTTTIQLLECQENEVLVSAAAALSKFGSKGPENLEILFDLNIVASIIPLLGHEEIFIRRFSTKLLAEMTTLASVRDFLLNSERYIPLFTNILLNDTDIFMQEFVSLILAQLSKDMFGVAQLLGQCNNLDFLFERIRSPDPDVKKNSIEITNNLLRDPLGAQQILETKAFSFSSIFELLKQPYPVIQLLTLDVIKLLVARNKDEYIQELFRCSRGLETLLNILDNDESGDLHQKVLQTLASACDNQNTAEAVCTIGGVQKLLKYMENCNKKLTVDLLNIIIRLANPANGRKELDKHGIVLKLLNLLHESPSPDVADITYYGIARMIHYGPAAETITLANLIPIILVSMKNENTKQSVRDAATYCLAELLACDRRNCYNLLDIKGESYLISMIKQSIDKIPLETQTRALQCLTSIGGYHEFREKIIDSELIDALCTPLKLMNNCSNLGEVKVVCCDTLSIFCIEDTARAIFLHLEGPRKVHQLLLDSESVPVRDAAARLISQLCTDYAVASRLILVGCLEYMIRHRSVSSIVPSWETCIKALLNSYLPAKFACTGRLSLHDITKDGFYVMGRNVHPFPILDQLFSTNINPAQTIYVCYLAQPRLSNANSVAELQPSIKSEENNDTTKATKSNTFSIYNSTVTNAILAEDCNTMGSDPFLYDLVESFKRTLIAREPKYTYEQDREGLVNIRYIKSRAKMLGEFVSEQMSGPYPSKECVDHQLEIHLNEIKRTIGTNVIPLGLLRVGSYLEKALLFKVIADRICLPAALVRGGYGKAWIEIALPEMETQADETPQSGIATSNRRISPSRLSNRKISVDGGHRSFESPTKELPTSVENQTSSIFPTKLLRTNYLVDLMKAPGKLILLGTKQAHEYCG